jgi:hypothetical protein
MAQIWFQKCPQGPVIIIAIELVTTSQGQKGKEDFVIPQLERARTTACNVSSTSSVELFPFCFEAPPPPPPPPFCFGPIPQYRTVTVAEDVETGYSMRNKICRFSRCRTQVSLPNFWRRASEGDRERTGKETESKKTQFLSIEMNSRAS